MKLRSAAGLLALGILTSFITWLPIPAQASGSGVDYYISAPFVQNSHVDLNAATTYFEDFNNFSLSGSTTSANGTVSWSSPAVEQTSTADVYGGATSTSSSPVVGGSGSRYIRPARVGSEPQSITVSFATAQRYLGFWWSAGSPSNEVKFLSQGQDVLTLTTADLRNLFGTAPTANQVINQSNALTFTDGTTTRTYPKGYYFGNPRGYSTTTPTQNLNTFAYNEPFTYLNVFATGTFSFDQVVFSGGGFEFDNLVTSSVAQTPNLLIHYQVGSIYPAVTFNNNGGQGTMAQQMSSNSAPLNANTFTRNGYQFLGWNTASDGSGTTYSNQANFGFISNTTLYAQWGPNEISFDANGGSGSMPNQAGTQSASISPNTFTRAGYTFAGWNSSQGGSGTSYADESTYSFASSTTLYAQWQAIAAPVPPEPSRYEGPTVELRETVLQSNQPIKVIVRGNKLDRITSVSVLGKAMAIDSQSRTELTFTYTPLSLGVFAVDFVSEFGKLTALDAITVIAPPVVVIPETESPEISQPEPEPFMATKRFFNFIGDRSLLVSKDRRAISTWISNYEGVQEVTCLGSTSGAPMIATDPSLARKRATNACNAIAKQLPNARIVIKIENGKGIGQFFRAVQITIKGVKG